MEARNVEPVLLSRKDSFSDLNQQAKDFPIISPELFNSEESCRKLIDRLAIPNNVIEDTDLMALVIKYFNHYMVPSEEGVMSGVSIPLKETSLMFHTVHAFFDYFRVLEKGKVFSLNSLRDPDQKFFHDICPVRYSIGILGDVSATAAVVKDIVHRQIDPNISRDEFRGLDLGSGSGILGLAQYILAKRNGFKSTDIIGIDNNRESVDRSNNALFPYVRTHLGDSTKSMKYKKHLTGPLHFLSNENIPSSGIVQGENEPFMINFKRLKSVTKIPSQVFPYGIEIAFSEEEKNVVACADGPWEKIPPSLARELSITKLHVSGKLISQNDLWKSISGTEHLPQLQRWYRRWGSPFGEFKNKETIEEELSSF